MKPIIYLPLAIGIILIPLVFAILTKINKLIDCYWETKNNIKDVQAALEKFKDLFGEAEKTLILVKQEIEEVRKLSEGKLNIGISKKSALNSNIPSSQATHQPVRYEPARITLRSSKSEDDLRKLINLA